MKALISAAICTRSGSIVVSRQFLPISRQRIESLLTQFPRLLKDGQEHTFVETEEVRFLYQPMEGHYLVLITSRASNILQDIDTLRLLGRLVAELVSHLGDDEQGLREEAVEILFAFDEVVSLGYRERGTLGDIKTILAMESHEEMIQEIIAKNKMQEAKEEAKRKIKQMEMEKRETARKASTRAAGYPGSFAPSSTVSGLYSPGPSGFSELGVNNFVTPPSTANIAPSSSSNPAKPMTTVVSGLGKGMKLGKKISDL